MFERSDSEDIDDTPFVIIWATIIGTVVIGYWIWRWVFG